MSFALVLTDTLPLLLN